MKILSVIIPVYNVEKYLRRCLDSVLVDNAINGIEVICVNDGSIDGSLQILEEYSVTYPVMKLISQPNLGLSAARNTGIKYATGEYVYFLDSDDYLYPCVLQRIIEYVCFHDVDTLCTNVLLNGELKLFSISTSFQYGSRDEFMAMFNQQIGYPYPIQAWLYVSKRDFLLNRTLTFKEGYLHEDEDFTPRLIYHAKKIGFLNYPCQYHRVLRPGAITSLVTVKHITDSMTIVRDLVTFFKDKEDGKIFYPALFGVYMSQLRRMRLNKLNFFDSKIDVSNLALLSSTIQEVRTTKLAKLSPYFASMYYFYETPSILRKLINCLL